MSMFVRQRASNDSEIRKASTSTVTVQIQEINENVDNVDNIVDKSAGEDVDKNDVEKVDEKSAQIVRSNPAKEKISQKLISETDSESENMVKSIV